MTPSKLTSRPAKLLALVAGISLALATVAAHRVPAGTGRLGFDVELSTAATGELSVAPQGRVAVASGLVPGGRAAAGTVLVANQTSARLDLAPIATAPPSDADRSVWIAVTRGHRTLASASLADLRRARRPAFALGPHERAVLKLHAWIPAGAPPGWQGRIAQVQIGWRAWIGGKVRR